VLGAGDRRLASRYEWVSWWKLIELQRSVACPRAAAAHGQGLGGMCLDTRGTERGLPPSAQVPP